MNKANRGITAGYDIYISRALATEGGHLSIGRGGFSLYFGRGAHLSGYDCEPVKAACIAAGLPVIDSRMVDFAAVARLAIKGPMIAVGEPPSRTTHGTGWVLAMRFCLTSSSSAR